MRAMRFGRMLGSGWSRALRVGAAVLAAVGVVGVVPPVASASPRQQALTWTELSPPVKPGPRDDQAMAYDAATGTVVLFGGYLKGVYPIGDTWTWDGTTWTEQSVAVHPNAPACGATMAYDAATGTVVLVGGGLAEGIGGPVCKLTDTWTWDGTTWTQQAPATNPPAACAYPYYYECGGIGPMVYDAATGTVVLLENGTWTWNGTTWTQATTSASPPGGSMAYDAATGTVVLFGGGETWTWNGTTWTEQAPATSPPARSGAYMAYDAATGTVVLFGGLDAATSCMLNGTWAWDGTTWTKQAPADSPSTRASGAMVYDTATGNVVLFGGYAYTPNRCHYSVGGLNQTWTWG
jgi:hypothetical protein